MNIVSLDAHQHDSNQIAITITIDGVQGTGIIIDSIKDLNSILAGDIIAGAIGFVSVAMKIYTAIKNAKI